MKVLLNVTLGELEKQINRQIEVDEKINLKDLCEFIIVSMNGTKIPIYELEHGKVTYYPYLIKETELEKTLENLKFNDLNLKKGKRFTIEYDFDNSYYFEIVIDDIYETKDDEIFRVLSGKGYGLLENQHLYSLKHLFNVRNNSYLLKNEKDYLQKIFDLEECNKKIRDYIENKKIVISPKRYIFNVALEGFNTKIKRKIIVDNDIKIDDFCRYVIVAMNGDLSHGYSMKISKNHLSEYYNDIELFYLNLKEKQSLKIIYDWGDNWIFKLTLSKIIDDYGENDFEVISGSGYGIIDDCGGIFELSDIFSGKNTGWGKHDINDFNLEKCNKNVRNIN